MTLPSPPSQSCISAVGIIKDSVAVHRYKMMEMDDESRFSY